MAMFSARGLHNFISDIRNSQSTEEEERRVEKELAKLRKKFTQTQPLTSYDKKKYVWKLIYIYMLGYEVEFGHMQIINLLSSSKYSEKCIGYVGTSLLLHNTDDMMTLVINSIRTDLVTAKNAQVQSLALTCVANIASEQLCESLSSDVINIFLSNSGVSHIRKKSCMTIRRIFSINPEWIPIPEILGKVVSLLKDPHLGVASSAAALAASLCKTLPEECTPLFPVAATKLSSLINTKTMTIVPQDYMYYTCPNPWLQISLLQILQATFKTSSNIFPEATTSVWNDIKLILSRKQKSKTAKHNATYAVLFQAIHFVISTNDNTLKTDAIALLESFISVKEANIRYVGLNLLYTAYTTSSSTTASVCDYEAILAALKDSDNSVRRRALDLLFVICNAENAESIVNEMVNYLLNTTDVEIQEEMVLKISILSEKFAPNLEWYVDTILRLVSVAPVSDEIWHRVVQTVTNSNSKSLQQYAAVTMYHTLEPPTNNSTAIKLGAYVLGEFGYLMTGVSSLDQFKVLSQHFSTSSDSTKGIILTALVKIHNRNYPELQAEVSKILSSCTNSFNIEVQQRACEYLNLSTSDTMKKVLESMPVYPVKETEDAAVIGLTVQDVESMSKWFKILLQKPRGILFENTNVIQVGLTQEYEEGGVVITLFYGNKSATNVIKNFTTSFSMTNSSESLGINVVTDLECDVIEPQEQVKQKVRITCFEPFDNAPIVLTITFKTSSQQSYNLPLRLPVVTTSFIKPKSSSFDNTLSQQLIFTTTSSNDCEEILGALHFATKHEHGNEITASGSFTSNSSSIDCIVVVQDDKVTVRSSNSIVCSAVKSVLAIALS